MSVYVFLMVFKSNAELSRRQLMQDCHASKLLMREGAGGHGRRGGVPLGRRPRANVSEVRCQPRLEGQHGQLLGGRERRLQGGRPRGVTTAAKRSDCQISAS
eukprot:scaffold442817_cov45-Prasinocladus_malaysianus.AAC.1